ncbi:14-3-3 protein [Annulohypoxylon truncatum]|uniref:14-3-3 protein n=1 Tax=Annulohypoxylon truncatum TaxID=327061 RepID=UPI0020081FBC|nr:14-3-3 protein [Annulohypoxylon truncatum]KAI1214601.1 14-3-3 protein [Annulohypoxylon truncatum]
MASSEVDQKFLGRLAKSVEPNNALLASMLFKILGLSINVAGQLVKAKKQRRLDATRLTQSLELYFHIIWLSREGLVMLEQYVLPMVGDYVELKVLAYKLRASFYHIFVQFHNNPPVSPLGIATTPEAVAAAAATMPQLASPRVDKGKGVDRGDPTAAAAEFSRSSVQPTHPIELGGPAPPPGFEAQAQAAAAAATTTQVPAFTPEAAAAFLLPYVDYLPTAHQYFREACALADGLLWGSHSLRLSVKTEYAAFLYECVHDREGSRRLARDTIAEVYEASEGMDDDMFNDACELVTVLGKMMKRGLGSGGGGGGGGGGSRSGGRPSPSVTLGTGTVSQGAESSATVVPPVLPVGMENPI